MWWGWRKKIDIFIWLGGVGRKTMKLEEGNYGIVEGLGSGEVGKEFVR